jgi:hypothetical protein
MRSWYTGPRLISKPNAAAIPRSPRSIPPHVAEAIKSMFTAIGRVDALLTTCGLGWSDVAAAFAPSLQLGLPLGESPSTVPAEDAKSEELRWVPRDRLLSTLAEIERRSPSSLGERSRKFIEGLRALAGQYEVVRLTAKQCAWYDSLCADAGLLETERG